MYVMRVPHILIYKKTFPRSYANSSRQKQELKRCRKIAKILIHHKGTSYRKCNNTLQQIAKQLTDNTGGEGENTLQKTAKTHA